LAHETSDWSGKPATLAGLGAKAPKLQNLKNE
jgi:hypothetical protein